MRIVGLIFALLLIGVSTNFVTHASSRRERTMQVHKQRSPKSHGESVVCAVKEDTIKQGMESIVRLSGYDKPLTSSRESMHVTNLSDSLYITGLEVSLQYVDMHSRELHSRTVMLNVDIKPGHTEMVTFPTWDVQRSFYYTLSVKPRRQATPYDIKCSVNFVTCR